MHLDIKTEKINHNSQFHRTELAPGNGYVHYHCLRFVEGCVQLEGLICRVSQESMRLWHSGKCWGTDLRHCGLGLGAFAGLHLTGCGR